jgi:hypothetical protein
LLASSASFLMQMVAKKIENMNKALTVQV